jgi:hypothetical protein
MAAMERTSALWSLAQAGRVIARDTQAESIESMKRYRKWFACPARGCGRRVAKLYGGRIFACRHCYQLAYPFQREAAFQRSQRRADRSRTRLRWREGFEDCRGEKPKGMHWRTYHRLVAELEHFEEAADVGFAVHFAQRFGRLVGY